MQGEIASYNDKKLFFVTYDYPPLIGPGRVTTSKLTKYLLRAGWTPVVLTTLPKLEEGPSLPVEIPEELVYREANWERLEMDNPFSGFIRKAFEKMPGGRLIFRALFYRYDCKWRRKIVKRGMEIASRYKPSIILASCGFAPEGLLAARELSQRLHIPWIAHMRDPWTRMPSEGKGVLKKMMQAFKERIERKVLRSASAIITPSEWLEFAVDEEKPIYVILNGYDPEVYPKGIQRLPRFTITYCGGLLGMPLEPLLLAIAKLKEEGYLKKFPLETRFFVGDNDRKVIEALTNKFAVKDEVKAYNYIPHQEVIKKECESTILLLLWNSPKYRAFLGTKFTEYIGAKRPILVIAPRDFLSAKKVMELKAGFVCENDEELYQFLKKALRDFYERGDVVWEPDWKAIEELSWENQARKFAEILEIYAER